MNYDEFVSANPTLDPLESIRKFSDQTRSDLLAAGRLTEETNREINTAAVQRAVVDGHIAEPTNDDELNAAAASLFTRPVSNDIVNLAARKASEEGDDETAKRLRTYTALQAPAVKANFASAEEYDASLSAAKADAESLLDESRIADTKRYALKNGLAKIATYTEGGKLRVDAAPDVAGLDDKTIAEYVRANPQFVDPTAALDVARSLKRDPNLGVSHSELLRKAELQAGVTALAETDPALKTHIDEITKGFGMEARDTGTTVVDTLAGIAGAAGSAMSLALSAGYRGLTGQPMPEVKTGVMSKTPEALAEYLYGNTDLGRQYTKKELLDVSKDLATAGGVDALGYDEANPAASVRKLSTGQLVMPTAVMANKALFDSALEKSGASQKQKDLAAADRVSKLDAMGKQMLPVLANADSDVLDFYNEKKAAGWTDGAILDSLTSNVKYSGVLNRAENFGLAALKTVTDLIPTLGKALPDGGLIENIGYGINKKINDEMAANQLLAKQYGKDMGWVQQFAEQLPQLAADVLISRGIGRAAGAATRGAAFVAPETAAALSEFRNVRLPSLVGKEVAESIASKLTVDPNTVGWLASQGARIFGSTYVSTRSSLEAMTNADGSAKYTPDQIDAMATENAVVTAAADNAITYGFNKISGGKLAGAESLAAGKGLSTRKLREFYNDLQKGVASIPREIAGEIKLDSFDDFIRSSTSFWSRPVVGVLFGGAGEGAEEMIQNLTEDTLNAISTGADLDLIESGRQAFLAASLGAAMGVGSEAISQVETQLFRDPKYQRAEFEEQVLKGTIDKLRSSNSPMTAAFLETQLGTARARKVSIRDQFEQTTKDYRDILAARELIDSGELPQYNRVETGEEMTVNQPSVYNRLARLQQTEQRLLAETPEEEMSEPQLGNLASIRQRIEEANAQISGAVIPMGGEAAPAEAVPPVRERDGQLEWTFLDEVESESRMANAETLPFVARPEAAAAETPELTATEPEPTIAQRVSTVLADRFPNVVRAIDSLRKSKDKSLATAFAGHVTAAEAADGELHNLRVERALALRERNKIASLLGTEQKKQDLKDAAEQQQLLLESGAMAGEAPLRVKPVSENILEYTRQRDEFDSRIADLDTRIRGSVARRDESISTIRGMFETRERTVNDALAELKASINETLEEAAEKIAEAKAPKRKLSKATKVAELVEPTPEETADAEANAEALAVAAKAEIAADIADAIEQYNFPEDEVLAAVEEVRVEAERSTGKGEAAKKAAAKLAALMPTTSDVAAARKTDTAEMRVAAKALKFDWKKIVAEKVEVRGDKPFLKNTDTPDGFASAGGFDLFNELLEKGVVPASKDLNSMLKERDYAYEKYATPFRNSLRAAIESRWPVHVQPESERVTREDQDETPDIYGVFRDTFRSTVGKLHHRLSNVIDSITELKSRRNVTVTEKALAEWRARRAEAVKKLAVESDKTGRNRSKDFLDVSRELFNAKQELPELEQAIEIAKLGIPLNKKDFRTKLDELIAAGNTAAADKLLKTGAASPMQLRIWESTPEAGVLEDIKLAEKDAADMRSRIAGLEAKLVKLKSGHDLALARVVAAEKALEKIDAAKPYTEASLNAAIKAANADKRALEKKIAEYEKKGEFVRNRVTSYESRLRVKRGLTKLTKRDGEVRRDKLPLIEHEGRRAGFFTNDPRITAAQLNEGYSVPVSKAQRATVNNAIKVGRDGFVKEVVLPTGKVKFAGDASPFIETPYESEELSADRVQFVAALPEIPSRLTYLLGNTAVSGMQHDPDSKPSQQNQPLNEEQYVNEAYQYLLNRDVKLVRDMEAYLMNYSVDYTDLAAAIVTRYMRTIREFGLGQQILDMQMEGASPERIEGYLWSKFNTRDRKNKTLAPEVEKMLRAKFGEKFGKNASPTLLLKTYAAQLANEVAAARKVAPVSDEQLDAILESGSDAKQMAKAFGKRFASGRPPALRTVAAQVYAQFRSQLALRRPAGNVTDSLDAAIAAGLPSDADRQQAAEYLAAPVEGVPSELVTGRITPQSELDRVIATIDANKPTRIAFETIATAYGVVDAQSLTTRELIDLFRDELSPHRQQAEANLKRLVSEEADRVYTELVRSRSFRDKLKYNRKVVKETDPEIISERDSRAELRVKLAALDNRIRFGATKGERDRIAQETLPRRKELRAAIQESVLREKELTDARAERLATEAPTTSKTWSGAEEEALQAEAMEAAYAAVRVRFSAATEEGNPLAIVKAHLRPLIDAEVSLKFATDAANAKQLRSLTHKAYREAVRGTRSRIEGVSEINRDNVRQMLYASNNQFGRPQRGDTVFAMDKYNYGTFYGFATSGKHDGMASVGFVNRESGATANVFLDPSDIFTVSRTTNGRTERLNELNDTVVFNDPTIGPVSPETRALYEKEGSYTPAVPTEEEQYARVSSLLGAFETAPDELVTLPSPETGEETGPAFRMSQLQLAMDYLLEMAESTYDPELAASYREQRAALADYIRSREVSKTLLHSISVPPVLSVNEVVTANDAEIFELGLVSGNPDSGFAALENAPADLQPLAKLLLKHRSRMTGMRVQIVTMPNSGWAAKYSPASRTITINRAGTNGRGVIDALMHEMLHDLLYTAVRSSDPAAKRLVAKLESLRANALAKAQADGNSDAQLLAGLSSVDELASYVFTSKDFQRKLSELDGPRNFLQKIIDAIVSFFTGNPPLIRGTMNDLIKLAGYTNPRPYGTTLNESAEMLLSTSKPLAEPIPRAVANAEFPNIVFNPELESAFASREDSDSVFVNPKLAAELVADLNDRSARNVLRSLHNHEVAHIATFKTITPEQRDHVANTIPESEMWDVADRYYAQIEPDRDKRYALLQAERDNGTLTNSKIAYEWLRARSEILNSGYTSEEELSFWRRNPSLLSVFTHYVRGLINRLSAMINGPADSRTAGILNRVARAHQKLIGGDVIESVDDAIAKIVEGEASFIYAIPVAGKDQYDLRGPIGRVVGKYLGTGDAPAQVRALINARDAHAKADTRVVERFQREMNQHAKNGLITAESAAALNEALGGHIEVDGKKLAALNKKYDAQIEAAEAEFRKTNRLASDKEALGVKLDELRLERNAEFDKLWAEADNGEVRRRQDEALARLPKPVADTMRNMIKATADEQRMLVEDPNMPTELKAVIGSNMGVHVVRSYRAFSQKGWWKTVKKGGTAMLGNETVDFDAIRDNALRVFVGFAEKQLNEKYAKSGMTTAAIKARVKQETGDVANRMFDSFIDRYDEMAAGLMIGRISPKDVYEAMTSGSLATHQNKANALRAGMKNYLARNDVPDWMRELMGEITDPVEAAVRTYVTVSTLASNQLFLSRLREEGIAGGWLTHDPASRNDDRGYEKISAAGSGAYVDVFAGLYGPPALKQVLDVHFKQAAGLSESSADSAVRESVSLLRKAAGSAMGIKTLLSVGFIPRNALSDFGFFAPFQGLAINPFKASRWKLAAASAFSGIKTDADAEAKIREYILLGIVNDDANSAALRQQVRGYSENPEETLAKLGNIASGLQSADVLDKAKAAAAGGKTVAGFPLRFMAKASETVANHLKIMVFEQELDWLRNAYGEDPEWNTPDAYGITRLQKEAARKTNMTTQSRSSVMPVVSAFARSPLGSLFAPFISFKSEVARIMWNTPKLAFEEMNSDSDVIRKRGRFRMLGMMTTATMVPLTLDALLRVAFAGLGKAFGDDEDLIEVMGSALRPRTDAEMERDEALRKGLPEWQQNNPISFAVTGSKVRTVDMTYINPFSVWMSPFLRSIEHIRTGDEERIADTFTKWTTGQLIGEQIAFGAVTEAFNNRDDRGNLIATPDMPFFESLLTRSGYALKAAYMPPSATFVGRVLEGTGGSQKAKDGLSKNRNRIELVAGELLGIRPRAYDLEMLYETGMKRENAKLRDMRSVTSAATSNYPVEEGLLADKVDRENRARVNRGIAMKQMLSEFGKLGLDTGRMISLAREAGVSKEAAKLAAAGYVTAYNPSLTDKKDIYYRRQEVDGTGAKSLLEIANAVKQWEPMIRLD